LAKSSGNGICTLEKIQLVKDFVAGCAIDRGSGDEGPAA
jgi:hypothetical protein